MRWCADNRMHVQLCPVNPLSAFIGCIRYVISDYMVFAYGLANHGIETFPLHWVCKPLTLWCSKIGDYVPNGVRISEYLMSM